MKWVPALPAKIGNATSLTVRHAAMGWISEITFPSSILKQSPRPLLRHLHQQYDTTFGKEQRRNWMKIVAHADVTEIDGDYGTYEGTIVTCSRCGHEVQVGGSHEGAWRRAAIMLREECPRSEQNFYDIK